MRLFEPMAASGPHSNFRSRVWGSLFFNDSKASLTGPVPSHRKQARSPVLEDLTFRSLRVRSAPGGSLTLVSPPGGFRV